MSLNFVRIGPEPANDGKRKQEGEVKLDDETPPGSVKGEPESPVVSRGGSPAPTSQYDHHVNVAEKF